MPLVAVARATAPEECVSAKQPLKQIRLTGSSRRIQCDDVALAVYDRIFSEVEYSPLVVVEFGDVLRGNIMLEIDVKVGLVANSSWHLLAD